MTRHRIVAAGMLVAIALAGSAAWLWWPRSTPVPAASPQITGADAPLPAPPSSKPASSSASAVDASPPEPRASAAPLPVTGIRQAFVDLLGAKAAASWLQPDEFPRRFVATVDNLTREQAPSLLWPIEPTGGHFTVIEHQGRMVISPDNALRYAPFVQGLELVDTAQAVALYVRLLPMLQKAYEDLGFPGQRFHARLLNVIDHLLAAPDAPELINLKHTAVRGPIPSVTPWVRYEFADATMESASAGHKLMVRVGASHQRRLKAKLREFRAELARQASK